MTAKKVIIHSIHIRSGPSSSTRSLGYVNRGDILQVTEEKGVWNKIDRGWVCGKIGNTIYLSLVESPPKDVPPAVTPADPAVQDKPSSGYLPNYKDDFNLFELSGKALEQQNEVATIRNVMVIHGLPYQFLESVDTRITTDTTLDRTKAGLGRKYSEKIISRIPLLLLTPGEPKFMTNYSKADRETILSDVLNVAAGGGDRSAIDKLMQRPGRYYTFEFTPEDYYSYVNATCNIGARFLKIHQSLLDGKPMDQVDWNSYTKPRLEAFTNLGEAGAVPFYIHAETQISESFSNGTTQSMLASKTNSASDLGREMNFLLGYGSNMNGLNIDGFTQQGLSDNIQNTDEFIKTLLNKSNLIQNVTSNLLTVATGGKLIFPEIWSDSNFSRSYDINIRLTTPDCDKLSWYLNIYVPLMHLICMATPRNVTGNPNGYIAPFLVRGYYKGLFSCDMGIITNMTINKGQESAWTKEGLPTVVDVNFTLKDLYDTLSITSMRLEQKNYDTMNNTALMDYMANMCGININKPEVMRQIDMWFVNNVINRVVNTALSDIYGKILQNVENSILNIYNGRWRI